MDDGVMAPERVDLVGDAPHLRDARNVADDDRVRLGQREARICRARSVARMQRHPMAPFGQKPPGHQAKAIGGAGDEDAGHCELFLRFRVTGKIR
jgi:hypothetical protein